MVREAKTFLAAAVLSGCAAVRPAGFVEVARDRVSAPGGPGRLLSQAVPGSWYLPLAGEIAGRLASDMGDFEIPEEVSLPPMDRWPRTFADAGPFYALAQFSPLVAPLGVLKENGRADAGYGIGALFGYKLPLSNALALGLEVQTELSEHVNPSSDVKAHQTRTGFAVRVMFRFDEVLRPFGVAGIGQYDMEFDSVDPSFFLSGLGVFMGGGVDYVQSDRLTIRGEMTLHIWDAAEKGSGNGGVAQTLFLGAGAAFTF